MPKGSCPGKSTAMLDRASQVLRCLLDAPVVTVDSGFAVESRTSYGIDGEDRDLALSVEWRDAEGCLWAADFSEGALALAELRGAALSLLDLEGAKVVFRLYQPVKSVTLSPG